MATALFYQPQCGIAGDMHLAALIDLGVPLDYVETELARLGLGSAFSLRLSNEQKMGISGVNIRVIAEDQHDHRHHSTIQRMIRDAGFSPSIERRALDIFQLIANAEGKIHGIAPDDVHFHEVGAIDSIVDIVAAAICIDYLQPQVILCNPVEVGSGFVDCAHGCFPVPAPATQELLVSAPCTYGGVKGECTTPTGAAILAASVDEYVPRSAFKPSKIGYGIGVKDFEIPNVLRVALGDYHAEDELSQHVKLEANIDDMSPEAFEPLMNALFDAGAADVYLTPIVMKKKPLSPVPVRIVRERQSRGSIRSYTQSIHDHWSAPVALQQTRITATYAQYRNSIRRRQSQRGYPTQRSTAMETRTPRCIGHRCP